MTEQELGLLGLGSRAGTIVIGTERVRDALKRGGLALVVLAADHGARTYDKVVRLARRRGVRTVVGPDAAELGRRLGRTTIQAVGVRNPNLAGAIGEALGGRSG